MKVIYQAIREGQSYGRLIQQVTRMRGEWHYRFCMYSGGPVKFSRWMTSAETTGDNTTQCTISEWRRAGYERLVR